MHGYHCPSDLAKHMVKILAMLWRLWCVCFVPRPIAVFVSLSSFSIAKHLYIYCLVGEGPFLKN